MQSIRSAQTRTIALLTGGLLTLSAFLPALGLSVAHADTPTERKEKNYKTGATILGAAAAYLAIKKKNPVAAAAAGAAAYYAYKKGQKANDQANRERSVYDPGYNDDRTAQYPDDDGGYYDNGGYVGYPDNDGGYYPDNGGGYANLPGDYFPDYSSRGIAPKSKVKTPRFSVK